MANGMDKVPGLLDSITLVDNATTLAEAALLNNPSVEDDRALRRLLLRLKAERAVLDAELDAALAEESSVQGPSTAQLAQIEVLTAQVEQATNAGAAVNASIALVGKVLDLATAIVAH
jgi:hypothetical protein